MNKNPLNDDLYDGNDEQIEYLKEAIIRLLEINQEAAKVLDAAGQRIQHLSPKDYIAPEVLDIRRTKEAIEEINGLLIQNPAELEWAATKYQDTIPS